jgi:hypothetical protein
VAALVPVLNKEESQRPTPRFLLVAALAPELNKEELLRPRR